ncbi:hypothetical protein [Rhodohalobacter sp. 8-1]|uniref:hypothetical protein n=1 Tax=Rhodohalobacter sp. 8-1 TaxID=3131972 RepID=UPI0030ED9D5D
MKTISFTIAILLMLGLLLGLGWLGYVTIDFLIGQFGVVDSQTSAVLTIATVSVLLSALIIAAAIKSLANSIVNSNHSRKLELYSQLINELQNHDQNNHLSLEQLRNHLIIWANDSVLQEYNSYLELVSNTPPNSNDLKEQTKKLIKTIRQDARNGQSTINSTTLSSLLDR